MCVCVGVLMYTPTVTICLLMGIAALDKTTLVPPHLYREGTPTKMV